MSILHRCHHLRCVRLRPFQPVQIMCIRELSKWFPSITKIKYEGIESSNPLTFKYYNPSEILMGKSMEEWLRFSVCYWHTFRGTGADQFGLPTISRFWDDGSNSIENAKRRISVAFEFFEKLGVKYYTFHDRDISPEGASWKETHDNFDIISDCLLEYQKKTGIELLWGTANIFSHPRYMNGGATSPDFTSYAYAAAQVKKAMEITHKLGGKNYVFWGGREGYNSILNTDLKRELDHHAQFLKMAKSHKEKIGADFQLLIEPKPREPMKHQYDYDAQTCIGFLKQYELDKDFKLNIEPNHTTLAGHDYEHDVLISSIYGYLGSIDSNTGDTLLGWDTDQFPMDIKKATLIMRVIINMGGLSPGGLNFDCKLRRESTDIEDMFISHIGAMDTFARGLRIAVRIINDKRIHNMISSRYSTFNNGIGKKVEEGTFSMDEAEKYILDKEEDISFNYKPNSGKQELYEMILNEYIR